MAAGHAHEAPPGIREDSRPLRQVMSTESYNELSPQTQRIIDACIYVTELNRITGQPTHNDEREACLDDRAAMVDYLREKYAADLRATPLPSSEANFIIHFALTKQKEMFDAPTDVAAHMNELTNYLTNLPYPSPPSKGRGGRS